MSPSSPGAADLEQPRRLVASLAALVADGPALPDASCRGASPGWDLHVRGESRADAVERRAIAVAACRRCYALADCRALLADLPPDTTGVWAGEVLDGTAGAPRAA